MILPKYTGTVHPEEWLKQVQAYCYLKDIEDEQKILKFCKFMIDTNIIIPDGIKSFDELVKALKSHPTFKIYKDSCKIIKKLKLNLGSDLENYLQFRFYNVLQILTNFRRQILTTIFN